MIDIVERLRQDAGASGGDVLGWEQLSALELEAATEIEQLREKIKLLSDDLELWKSGYLTLHQST